MKLLASYVFVKPGTSAFTFGEVVFTRDEPVLGLKEVNEIRTLIADAIAENIPYRSVVLLSLIKLPIGE